MPRPRRHPTRIAGSEIADSGKLALAGRDIKLLSPNKRDIVMVFQNNALIRHGIVAANIGFPLKVRKVAAREIARRADEALQQVGLDRNAYQLIVQLAGGQQQRVALARRSRRGHGSIARLP